MSLPRDEPRLVLRSLSHPDRFLSRPDRNIPRRSELPHRAAPTFGIAPRRMGMMPSPGEWLHRLRVLVRSPRFVSRSPALARTNERHEVSSRVPYDRPAGFGAGEASRRDGSCGNVRCRGCRVHEFDDASHSYTVSARRVVLADERSGLTARFGEAETIHRHTRSAARRDSAASAGMGREKKYPCP